MNDHNFSKNEMKPTNNGIIYAVTGFLFGVLITIFISSNAVNNNNQGIMRMMGMRNSMTSDRTFNSSVMDAHFIEQMIPHHEDAITVAKLAQDKAQHQEIKTLAQNIINDQTKEINEMKTWYKNWYGKDVPTGTIVMNQHGMMRGNSMHMNSDADLDKLKNSPNFDKDFIEEMIPHHQMAIMMASMLKNGTTQPEMKQLADNIITSQTNEINQMQKWYSDWGY